LFVDVVGMPRSPEVSNQSSSFRFITAEDMIKCASETAALKQLSGSLLVTSGAEAVSCTEIPCRDDAIDGAEDSEQSACEGSEAACSTKTDCDAECSVTTVATSLSQKTVAVAALPSGVYITKPSPPIDNTASTVQAGEDAGSSAGKCQSDSRRLKLQKLFPILHDLSQ